MKLVNKQPDFDLYNELIKRWINRNLKPIFSNSIKANFLIEIFWKVFDKINNEIPIYFNQQVTIQTVMTNSYEECASEICKNIVAIHKANMIFIKDRKTFEEDEKYKNELINDVVLQVKSRNYGAKYFRNKQIVKGDNFIYFPVPYSLFCLCIKGITLLDKTKEYKDLYTNIFNKSLSALSLLESNFVDSTYPLCRSVMELCIKLLVTKNHPECLKEHNDFVWFEIQRNCCGKGFVKEFINKFNNRLNKKDTNKVHYLHFGWVDKINDYTQKIKKPYSIEGLLNFVNVDINNNGFIEQFKNFYTMCHVYSHGNVGNTKYSLLHYFEASIMLYYVIYIAYDLICEETKTEKSINGIDIIKYLGKHFNRLGNQYSKRSTENFEYYYKNPK